MVFNVHVCDSGYTFHLSELTVSIFFEVLSFDLIPSHFCTDVSPRSTCLFSTRSRDVTSWRQMNSQRNALLDLSKFDCWIMCLGFFRNECEARWVFTIVLALWPTDASSVLFENSWQYKTLPHAPFPRQRSSHRLTDWGPRERMSVIN